MSQYPYQPSPYQPNYYGHQPPAPATHPTLFRAALFLFIIGGLTALGAFCFSGLTALAPLDALNEALAQQQKTMSEPIPVTAATVKTILVVIFVAVALMGVIHFALGFGVRKGSVPAIMTAVILTAVSLLVLLLFVFVSLLTIAVNPVAGVFDVLLTGIPAIALVFQFIWLLKARAVAASGSLVQQQHQMQMWQQQQMQQGSAQGGYPQPGIADPPNSGSGYGYGGPQQPMSAGMPVPGSTPPASSPSEAPAQTSPGGSDAPPRQE